MVTCAKGIALKTFFSSHHCQLMLNISMMTTDGSTTTLRCKGHNMVPRGS